MGCEGAGNRVRDPLMPTLTLRKRLRRARVAGPTTRRRNGAFSRGARGDAPRKKTTRGRKDPQIYADAGLTEGYLRGGDSSKSRPCRLASTRRRFHAIHSS